MSNKCNPEKAPANGYDKVWKAYFCKGMWANLTPDLGPPTAPFKSYVLTKLTGTGEQNLAGVLAIRRTKKQKDVLINFCPFCGVSYEGWLTPHLKKT